MSEKRSAEELKLIDEICYNAAFKYDFKSLMAVCKHSRYGLCHKAHVKDHCIVIACPVVSAQLKNESQEKTDNTSSPKLPDIEEVYKAVPFPSDEKEAAMFCAGLAECHKFIAGKIGR